MGYEPAAATGGMLHRNSHLIVIRVRQEPCVAVRLGRSRFLP
jgi:hypothetical protein